MNKFVNAEIIEQKMVEKLKTIQGIDVQWANSSDYADDCDIILDNEIGIELKNDIKSEQTERCAFEIGMFTERHGGTGILAGPAKTFWYQTQTNLKNLYIHVHRFKFNDENWIASFTGETALKLMEEQGIKFVSVEDKDNKESWGNACILVPCQNVISFCETNRNAYITKTKDLDEKWYQKIFSFTVFPKSEKETISEINNVYSKFEKASSYPDKLEKPEGKYVALK